MRRLATPFAALALLAAGLFAAVSIAQGGGLKHITTTGTTGLTTTTPGKVIICHRTGSKKHPFHAISVAAPAVRAHLRHGDVLGPCTTATVALMKRRGNGAAKHTTTTKKHTPTTSKHTTTGATQTNSTHSPGNSGSHGNGGGNGNGHGGGNGNGTGNGGGNGNGKR
jgi:hypothetical protein